MLKEKQCPICMSMFEYSRSDAMYCSGKCRQAAHKERTKTEVWVDKEFENSKIEELRNLTLDDRTILRYLIGEMKHTPLLDLRKTIVLQSINSIKKTSSIILQLSLELAPIKNEIIQSLLINLTAYIVQWSGFNNVCGPLREVFDILNERYKMNPDASRIKVKNNTISTPLYQISNLNADEVWNDVR